MSQTEWWQRGPVPGVPDLLQPVAHILLQISESVEELVDGLSESQWNARPADIASVAFHVRHIAGVVDRLFTYARGEALTDAQRLALELEKHPVLSADIPVVLQRLHAMIDSAVAELHTIDPEILPDFRGVGRAGLPSTVIGCLVHGAEHGMRHVGQLSVTVRIVRRDVGAESSQ